MSSLAIWPTLTCTFAATHTTRKSIQFGAYYSDDHYGFRHDSISPERNLRVEEVLSDDMYWTVPEALAQSYGVLCSPSVAMNEEGVPAVVPPVQVSDTVMFVTKVGYLKCMYIS